MPREQPATPPGTPTSLANPRYELFDTLRGAAAISVFVAHVSLFLVAYRPKLVAPYLERLDIGVSVFLLMSAFLLYRPFVRARYAREPRPSVLSYGVRRVLRVVPAYWVALPAVALIVGRSQVFTLEGILTYFPFLQIYDPDTIVGGIGQVWTVCVEVTFYIGLPLWVLWMARRRFDSDRRFLLGELLPLAPIAIFSVVWKLVAFEASDAPPTFGPGKLTPGLYTLPAYLDSFAVGLALAVVSVVWEARAEKPRLFAVVERRPGLFLLAGLALWWASGLGRGALETQSAPLFVAHHLLNAAAGLAFALPVVFGGSRRDRVRDAMRARWILWLGTISYGFYLWHVAFLRKMVNEGWLAPGGQGIVPFVVVGAALALLLGAMSWYAIERPAIRLGRRLPRRDPLTPRRDEPARDARSEHARAALSGGHPGPRRPS